MISTKKKIKKNRDANLSDWVDSFLPPANTNINGERVVKVDVVSGQAWHPVL